jgi:hypothetical protein
MVPLGDLGDFEELEGVGEFAVVDDDAPIVTYEILIIGIKGVFVQSIFLVVVDFNAIAAIAVLVDNGIGEGIAVKDTSS